ncbi:MAG TPA: M56 family metallopeptidase, partial [Gemmatimonadaceae bacterium]|nr:M56 family metallopeptidase [Gemmatimonadaceae bacterium]
MFSPPADSIPVIPLDAARAVATVYTVALLAMLPLVLAAVAAFFLRRSSAGSRVLVWRSAIVALALVLIGRQLPLHWIAWVVPPALAAPLVALGRVQVTASMVPLRALVAAPDVADVASYAAVLVRALFVIYVVGIATVVLPTLLASIRVRKYARSALLLDGGPWGVDDVRRTLGIRRAVRLVMSPTIVVPMTWGFWRPVVALPSSATAWSDDERRIVLLHELAHVRASDWTFNLAGRVVCALYWFHPGAWWIARGLREDCELACDDRVIAAGVRRSDYAELLVRAADAMCAATSVRSAALALSNPAGLRARLSAVLDTRHDVRPVARGWALVAAVG